MLTVEAIIAEIRERKERARRNMQESRSAGVNTPGFNQDLGHYDALGELLEWIEEESV